MAGGKGTRLRPISEGRPKPMVPLLDQPVIGHIITLLKRAGITEICTTLGYRPQDIIDYLGDGSRFGVSITHKIEKTPMGTAGGVLACKDFFGEEDFLVISGDAACDFDLKKLISYHKTEKSLVTIALYSHPEPLAYGLVVTDKQQRVKSFVEKPSWERVTTDRVNTGIYVVSAKAMSYVTRDMPFDFAKDLFPRLLSEGEKITALPMEGYWCDIGSPEAYLQSNMDALTGKLKVSLRMPQQRPGVFSDKALPTHVEVISPCMLSSHTLLEAGATIGPNAVILDGSYIGRNASTTHCVVESASVGAGAMLSHQVLTRGASIAPGQRFIRKAEQEKKESTAEAMPIRRRALKTIRELPCDNRARIMRTISESMVAFGADFTDGISLHTDKGKVRIAPHPEKQAICIEAHGMKKAQAEQLCTEYAEMIAKKTNE